ncbi:hypothetical protein TWF679_005677 [Orbilia oligospora]|uniref:Uncharacterized protein n=1 Tax=Orbilia oligospora TaxID=2813651 RepID=A0A8H8VBL6_ORBOL|nr:hypothetical protein TWF679_005677 [Orbilia oligospora]
MLDAFTTNLDSLRTFYEYQLSPSDETKHICREEGSWTQIFQGLGSLLSDNGGLSDSGTCKNELVRRPVSVEDYTKEMENLRVSIVPIYNVVDAWVCKHKMTDKSMTYFTLFKRAETAENPGSLKTLHFLNDYPGVLESVLKNYTEDIGETATKLITNLKARAAYTKNLMKTLGKAEQTKEEIDKITQYCDTLKGVVPRGGPENPETKKST